MKRWEVEKLQKIVDKLSMHLEIIGEMRLLMDAPNMPPAGADAIVESICDRLTDMADIIAELDGELTILGKSSGARAPRACRANAVFDSDFLSEKDEGIDEDED